MTISESEFSQKRTVSNDVVFDLRNVKVSFDMDRGTSQVLNGVSMEIYRDETLGVIGESGSGKSMFASALLNAVVEPGKTTGEIIYYPENGEPVDILSMNEGELEKFRWEEVAMVFQGAMSSFNPTMKIQDHFDETIKAHNADFEERMAHAQQILSDLHLDAERVLDSYPHELSGGMQQRVLIALSLVLEPEVLVMDEPTAALDLLMQRSIIRLLAKLQERYNLTIVFITHDLPLVAGLSNRLAVMYAFDFVEYGPSEEILRNASHPYTRALLKSVPSIDAPLEELHAIEGESPDPVSDLDGCSYAPRCPLADTQCTNVDPEYRTVDTGHQSACFYWEESDNAVTYSLTQEGDGLLPDRTAVDTGVTSSETVASLNDVSVEFDDSGLLDRLFSDDVTTVQAVNGVSLDIQENEVVALVGESGCGKTTLGKTAIGLQQPTEGSVLFRGQDINDAKKGGDDVDISYEEIRRSLQIIHQDPGSSLNPTRTVLASLAAPLKKWKPEINAEEREAHIYNLLERVGMKPASDYATRFPHQLSGGEQQRVALLRALLMSPDLILADEAVSALDVSLRVEMMDLMLELQNVFDTSYLFISHDFSNARYLAEKSNGRIGIMYLGELVEIGPADEVLRNPSHPYTKVLKWATPAMDPDVAAEEAKQEPPVREIDVPDPLNPPSGCRFHTRCPEAREACKNSSPELRQSDTNSMSACFREDEMHEYWNSEPLEDTEYPE
ncbi:peptide/nickel transport system ATP-binding protein [Haladaptatus litoreus]|uniref:Peptide/nickel transport system ATP-binding protein n=1 Tax=Haladaptatus litoreus TaxID=553468 RepID=A0A1N7DFN1_9EURY|nr:ABC transporter ATP-binding protein [Haladaptatus litoreus]SIR74699.1 peptide/nickel transport system ATP-binding protein [Haladaptatus litoreus]